MLGVQYEGEKRTPSDDKSVRERERERERVAVHRSMPPKPASTTWPLRRTSRTTGRNSIPNSNSTTPMNSRPPSSTTATATAAIRPPSTAIPTSSEPSQETRSIHSSNTKNTLQKTPHATAPAFQTRSQCSQKTLASNSELVKSDMGSIDGNKNEESGKSFEPLNSGIEHFGPEKIIHVEAVTVVGSGGGSKNAVNLSSVPVIRPHVQDEGSSKPIIEPESGGSGVAGPGNGKRKIVKKIVKVVKKVIKKKVPKRVLMNGSENQGLVVKVEAGVNLSEVTKNLNHANEVIEKSNVVDEVIEKTSIVNGAKEILNIAEDITENSNLVNNVIEKSNLVDGVTEKTSIINEVMEKAHITDEVTQKLKLVNSASVLELITGEKGNDLSGIDSMETETSKLNFGASVPEQVVLANDKSGIHTMDTDNMKSNDVITEVDRKDFNVCVPDSMEVEKVNCTVETVPENKEIANTVRENQSKDSIVENQNMDTINKADVGLVADRNVGPLGEKSVVLVEEKNGSKIRKPKSGSGEVESDRIRLNEGLLLSGEMEALERKKRRKTEIFVGGLDKDTREDDIRKVFEEAGVIVEVRLVMNGKTGKNKGFAFVRFATAADAINALAKYSKVEICGKQCSAAPVEGNDTIFLGNIDRNWKTEDVVTLLEKAGIEKIDKVTLKADPNNIEKNRGFAFVELETNKDAQIAFNKLQKKDAFVKNLKVKVAWAQPLIEPAEEEILKVKSVYAEYLPSSWDEEKVKEYFKRFGEIENVVLAKDLPSSRRKDFAFINYTTRDAALTCIESVSRERLEDDCSKVKMAVSLAKPISKTKQMKRTSDLTSKQLSKVKPNASQTSIKLHEPRNKGKSASSSYDHVKVDNRPSTTDELVQILRQQASSKHNTLHPRTGINVPDHRFPLPGSKRPFSLVGHDPSYMEPQGLSRVRMESSYPVSGPSSSSPGVGMLSFAYHHQQGPGFTSESVNGRRIYPSHFQTREQAPYYGDNNIYRRW
ncbi:hypothetical protein Pfo_004019 [Paulownia fortunei]|nr:hypothetical protein Pfo_004019 [Paulownia fortunei]